MHTDLQRKRQQDPAGAGWMLTVAWLGNGGVPDMPRPARRGETVDAALRAPPTIHVLDRPTPRTAAVSWSDPGVCHYGYQIWDMVPARKTGRCVLSGCAIDLGDAVYLPRDDGTPPLNAGAMIAAAFVG